ncbi:MAG: hypothetical protein V4482_04075 [Pseudomonadota bacterium]
MTVRKIKVTGSMQSKLEIFPDFMSVIFIDFIFFSRLLFERSHLLHARCEKDITIKEWIDNYIATTGQEISNIIFIDNLMAHCTEIACSTELSSCERISFEHNAYKKYFEKHYRTVLKRQLLDAYHHGSAISDAAILDEIHDL